jgi:hypothetical protein
MLVAAPVDVDIFPLRRCVRSSAKSIYRNEKL